METKEDKPNLGTAKTLVNGEITELPIINFLRAEYKDFRLISVAQLGDNTYVLSIENPESTGRNPFQALRLSEKSFISLLGTATLYLSKMGKNMEQMLIEASKENGLIDYSFDNIENYGK